MQHIPWEKIKSLQKEIDQLKSLNDPSTAMSKKRLAKKNISKKTKPLSIEGMLKGITFSEEEIEEAQKKVFDFKEIK